MIYCVFCNSKNQLHLEKKSIFKDFNYDFSSGNHCSLFFTNPSDDQIKTLIKHTSLGLLAMAQNHSVGCTIDPCLSYLQFKNKNLNCSAIRLKLFGEEVPSLITKSIFKFFEADVFQKRDTFINAYKLTLLVGIGTLGATAILNYLISTSLKTTSISSILVGGICAFATYKYVEHLNEPIYIHNKRADDLYDQISKNSLSKA